MKFVLSGDLPGAKAQRLMAPAYRQAGFEREVVPKTVRTSAVLVLLCPPGPKNTCQSVMDWRIPVIQRTEYPGEHSGQVSLPGGKPEPEDSWLWETACRETREEIGVPSDLIRYIGPLSPAYVTASNFIIQPFLAYAPCVGEACLRPDPREAAGCALLPLACCDPARAIDMSFITGNGQERCAPAWEYEGYLIWGATAMILAEVFSLANTGALRTEG